MYDGVEFNAKYPTRFTEELKKEMEDAIIELEDSRYQHVVDSFKVVKDFERSPSKPLTNATLKYNCVHLLSLERKDTYKYKSVYTLCNNTVIKLYYIL